MVIKEEYQDFTLTTFRKHIYQERTKQLSAPCWQHKRNEAGAKKHREETMKMKADWSQDQFDKMMSDLVDQWAAMK